MHFHLPKPLHGWREFAGEVGIIVVGVGIALGAEQIVDAIHWRHTVESESRALDADVSDMWNAMSGRIVIQGCVDRRLADISRVFSRHDAGQPLRILGPIGRPSVWTAGTSALEMASADGSLSHMGTDQKEAYFNVQSSYRIFDRAAWEERGSWRVLQSLDDPAELSEQDWRDLRRAYRDAADSNTALKFNLVFGSAGKWLTPFKRFRRLPTNNEAFTVPVVQQLCRPAVSA